MAPSSCDACHSGTFHNESGRDSCETCRIGSYVSDTTTDADGFGVSEAGRFCVPCPAARTAADPTSTYCTACLAGKSSTTNASTCFACQAGYISKNDASECEKCPAGQYQDLTGQTTCIDCTSPKTSFAGSSDCNACVEGYYYDEDNDECISVCVLAPLILAGGHIISSHPLFSLWILLAVSVSSRIDLRER